MIITRTPFRISFFGGGTDYPVWFSQHGGAALATTIDKYCYITARYLPPFFEHRHRIVWSQVETPNEVSEIRHPVVRAALQHLGISDGMEIHHNSDLPARSGLGSSSSFTVGLLNALYGLTGRLSTKARLAREAIHIEQEVLREAVGVQDQISVAHGGLNKLTFHDDGNFEVQPVILPRATLRSLQSNLLLFYTGLSRYASTIAERQIQAIPSKANSLERIGAMVEEGLGYLCSDRLDDFGGLLHEGWMLKRGIAEGISTDLVDEIYDTARRSGALGGKLLGAGGGGFVLLYVRPEAQARVRAALKNLLEIGFRFETRGSHIIHFDGGDELPLAQETAAEA